MPNEYPNILTEKKINEYEYIRQEIFECAFICYTLPRMLISVRTENNKILLTIEQPK